MRKLHRKLFWLLIFLLPTQLGFHFWPEWSYVFGLRVDYLSPTIYLTDLVAVVILGLWGVEEFKLKSLKLKITTQNLKFFLLIFSIFAFLLINSLLAKNPGAALYKLTKIIEFTLLGFYVAKNKFKISFLAYPLLLAVIYSSLIAIAQFLKQASLGGIFWWLGERTFNVVTPGIAKAIINGRLIMRPYATFSHPNVLSGFILISLIFLSAKDGLLGIKKILKWGAIILGMITIVLSFSRSAWLISLLVGLWLILSKKPLLRDGGIFLMIILAAVSLINLPFSTNEALSQRVYLIKLAILMTQSAPLAGIGLNNFISRLPDFWPTAGFIYWLQPAHNLYLLILAETGLVGLLLFGWGLFLTFKKLLIFKNQTLLIVLMAILILGFFDHYWLTLQQSQLLLTLVLGLSWSTEKV